MTTTPTADDLAAAAVSWDAALLQPRGIVALAVETPTADTLDWGDGKKDPITGHPQRHVYAQGERAYNVSAMAGEAVLATAPVVVRDGLAPNVTFADPAVNPNFVVATFGDDGPISNYEITWAPGVAETVVAPKGTVKRRGFTAGSHPIKIRDLLSGRTLLQTVDVVDEAWEPDGAVSQGENTMTALLVLSKPTVGGREITVGWGDGAAPTVVPAADAKEGFRATHPYAANGTYWVQVKYTDDPDSGRDIRVPIPFAAREGKGSGRP